MGVWSEVREVLERELVDGRELDWWRLAPRGAAERVSRFNDRQCEWLVRMVRDSEFEFSFGSYEESYGISHETARKDLVELADEWLVIGTRRDRRGFVFTVPSDLLLRLKWLGELELVDAAGS